MAGYRGFRKKKWNKSGCDPYNMGIPAKLYGCGEEWRYDLCELQKPNLLWCNLEDFNLIRFAVEEPRCRVDGYYLHVWDIFDGEVKSFTLGSHSEKLISFLRKGHHYNAYVVGFRNEDDALTCASNIVEFTMPNDGDLYEGFCIDNTKNKIDCGDYLEY